MAEKLRRARHIIDRLAKMKLEKANWNNLYETCAEYVMMRKIGFNGQYPQAHVQTSQVFDDTAPNANTLMAAALIGAMWPNGAKSFRLVKPTDMDEETEEVKQYYQWATRQMAGYMDNPKAGLITSLEEYMLDQGAFGISGIEIEDNEDDYETPLAYRARDAKVLYIDEGRNNFVDTVYIEHEMSLRQLIKTYGIENVAKQRREAYLKGKDTDVKVKVLQAIEPRMDADPFGFGNKNMPIASIHIDVEHEKIMLEKGFIDMPVIVARFWRAMGEKYGRSPSTQSLPSIMEANQLGELWLLAGEKTLDPPIMVADDGVAGNGIVNTSAGGITVVNVSGRINTGMKPIEPLFVVGDLQWTAARRTELAEIIKNQYFIDRLMDLNNEHRMQNPEVFVRNELRGQTLNTTYARQFAELFVPLIETTFNKLRRRGLLGVIQGSPEEEKLLRQGIEPKYIPEAIVKRMVSGLEVYKIEFISPATRIMQSEELKGIEQTTTFAANLAAVQPDVLDALDLDVALKRVQELSGAPREMIRAVERIEQMRQQRAELQALQMQMAQEQQQSETARNVGQAVSSVKDVA